MSVRLMISTIKMEKSLNDFENEFAHSTKRNYTLQNSSFLAEIYTVTLYFYGTRGVNCCWVKRQKLFVLSVIMLQNLYFKT